ncbi:hypothetical protein FH972_023689 [Carpinus fangiana]|uniref:BHLH domain-containing protein n=1 Tax=Carpinus fangiana TaxID=176857 RepID=A0A5N6KVX7_9ROSI|nr:hypothetical protein FH972_023689 [Carpinus fangiana]
MADVGFPDTPSMRAGASDPNSSNKRKRSAFETGNTPSRRAARSNNAQFPRDATADFLDTTGDEPSFDLAHVLQQDGSDSSALGTNANGGDGSNKPDNNSSVDAAAAALAHNYSMTVPAHPGDGFGNVPTVGGDTSFNPDGTELDDANAGGSNGDNGGSPSSARKPAVGTDEWHKVRKDNHKEVERRRRETINEGINEIAKIVPGCEKNKGQILARAVQYIQKLQDDASSNIDKWTFEKLVTEQAITEITQKCNRAFQERNAWKRLAAGAGVDVVNVDLGLPPDDDDEIDGLDDAAAAERRKEEAEQNAAEEVQRRKFAREEQHAASIAANHAGRPDADGEDDG